MSCPENKKLTVSPDSTNGRGITGYYIAKDSAKLSPNELNHLKAIEPQRYNTISDLIDQLNLQTKCISAGSNSYYKHMEMLNNDISNSFGLLKEKLNLAEAAEQMQSLIKADNATDVTCHRATLKWDLPKCLEAIDKYGAQAINDTLTKHGAQPGTIKMMLDHFHNALESKQFISSHDQSIKCSERREELEQIIKDELDPICYE